MSESERKKHLLSVVIVNWNTCDITLNCLESLFAQPTSVPYRVYVVDNASSDGSPEIIAERFPQTILIKNAENVGFARANNQVLAQVSTPYALLLNSDTIIPARDVFSPWVDFMEKNSDVGMSGCRLVFPDYSQQVGDAGYRPTLKSILFHSIFLSRLFPDRAKGLFLTNYPEGQPYIDVDWVSGAAMMLRMSAVKDAGLMNDSIFMFAEDIEWGCRFKSKGWRVVYLPFITIVHLQGASSKRQRKPSEFSLLWLKNVRKLFADLNRGTPVWTFDFFMALGFFLRAQFYGWRGLIMGSEELVMKGKRMIHYVEGILSGLEKV
ncbi:MAG: glycosyltransferase family 2 protein [Thermodesulforhabdaceae bacterium]